MTEEARLKLWEVGVVATKRNDSIQWDVEFPDFPQVLVFKDKDTGFYYYLVEGVVFQKRQDEILRLMEEHHQETWSEILKNRGGSPFQ